MSIWDKMMWVQVFLELFLDPNILFRFSLRVVENLKSLDVESGA